VNVAALLRHLSDLADFLSGMKGCTSTIADLRAVRDGLAPFADQPFADFAAFLRLADEYKRTGQIPIAATKTPRAKKQTEPKPPKAAKVPKLSRDAAQLLVRTLYEQAAKPGFLTDEQLDAELAKLSTTNVTDIRKAAAEADAGGRVKKMNVPEAIAEIKRAILGRKATNDRVEQ